MGERQIVGFLPALMAKVEFGAGDLRRANAAGVAWVPESVAKVPRVFFDLRHPSASNVPPLPFWINFVTSRKRYCAIIHVSS